VISLRAACGIYITFVWGGGIICKQINILYTLSHWKNYFITFKKRPRGGSDPTFPPMYTPLCAAAGWGEVARRWRILGEPSYSGYLKGLTGRISSLQSICVKLYRPPCVYPVARTIVQIMHIRSLALRVVYYWVSHENFTLIVKRCLLTNVMDYSKLNNLRLTCCKRSIDKN
jgi:hypothetical protein